MFGVREMRGHRLASTGSAGNGALGVGGEHEGFAVPIEIGEP